MIQQVGKFDFDKNQRNFIRSKPKMARRLGILCVNHFKEGFVKGGEQTDRSASGWRGRSKYAPRTAGRGILVGEGNLKKSIRLITATFNSIIIRSEGFKYAAIHNFGGTITQTPTALQRKFFWAMYKKTGNAMFKRSALAKKIKIKIPQREFVGRSRKLEAKLKQTIVREMNKTMNI